ncbi:copper resistance protein CopC [Nocardioides sp. Iso805N]|uniref:copper resistance protein CopC n=1 Tax=Nocardioides sp. Iso805N TaxID=1283287 RepID=UPI0003A84F55|nr:copper resistance protein CopC [Nocardioides sp. Iso805N]
MRCSDAREALSARYDGEAVPVEEAALRAHVVGCAECAAFEGSLAPADQLVRREVAEPAPDLGRRIVTTAAAQASRRRTAVRTALRLGVALLGVFELVTAAVEMLDSHDHESHESSSFTVALCVAMIYAALRPRLARGYVPVLASASVLLLLTSVEDVDHGAIGFTHELPHLGILLGTFLLWLLAIEDSGGPQLHRSGARRTTRTARPAPPPRLRAVGRTAGRTVGRTVGRGLAAVGLSLFMALSLVLLAGPASAHAVLESSDPRPDAVLAAPPGSVTLSFDEPVSLLPGSLRVYDPEGQRIDRGDVGHPDGHGERVSVQLRTADAQGSYLVSWRVVSADSHPVSGAFTFAVGKAGAAPPTPHDTSSTGISVGLAIARWLGYAGSALLVGISLVVAWCWAEGWRQRRVRRLVLAGGTLLAVGAVADLLLKGPYDAALGLGSVTDGALLREVLGSTYGHATVARLVLVALALVLLRLRPPSRLIASVLAVAFGLSFAFAGHAAAGSGRTLAAINDTVHVVSASAWLGGLVLVLVAIDSVAVVQRFSRLAVGAVLLLVATGLWQAARQVGSWAALRHTTYGHELLVKLLVIALVLGIAAGSRALVWRAEAGQPARIRSLVLAETVGLGIVLGITSALVATEPAKTAYHPSASGQLTLVGDTVQVSAVPVGDRQMDLHVYVFDKAGQPSDPKEITAAVSLPSKLLGPLPVTLAVAGPGHRQGTVAVPVAGQWRLAVTVRTTAIDEATGYVTLPIR